MPISRTKNGHTQSSSSSSTQSRKASLKASSSNSPAQLQRSTSSESISSDDSDPDDESAGFEMDGQELWAQSYCATCDCLIEPGQGIETDQQNALDGELTATPSKKETASNGLKSKTGTIKARPSSRGSNGGNETGGKWKEREKEGSSTNLKRTHSAGRLHAVGAAGPLGGHKRTGSAAARLNALNDLRLTSNKVQEETSTTTKPSLSRRSSASGGGNGSSRANSPSRSSNNGTSTLPRTKKSLLLSAASAAAVASAAAEEESRKRPAALYCSERCRAIDEERSSGWSSTFGMGGQDLASYLNGAGASGSGNSYYTSGPPRSNSVVSMTGSSNYYPSPYVNSYGHPSNPYYSGPCGVQTPESECPCSECIAIAAGKYEGGGYENDGGFEHEHADGSSTGGTVPSGASDTTESSNGAWYPYGSGPQLQGVGAPRRKQRTESGRLMTPNAMLPPSGHPHHQSRGHGASSSRDGYFPAVPISQQSLRSRTSPTTASSSAAPTIMAPSSSSSTAPESAGTQSSDSSRSRSSGMWEPRLRKPKNEDESRSGLEKGESEWNDAESTGPPTSARETNFTFDELENNRRSKSNFGADSNGSTTPAATLSSPKRSRSGSASVIAVAGGENSGESTPDDATLSSFKERRLRPLSSLAPSSRAPSSSPPFSRSMSSTISSSLPAGASPLRLLRRNQGSSFHGAPSVSTSTFHTGDSLDDGDRMTENESVLGSSARTLVTGLPPSSSTTRDRRNRNESDGSSVTAGGWGDGYAPLMGVSPTPSASVMGTSQRSSNFMKRSDSSSSYDSNPPYARPASSHRRNNASAEERLSSSLGNSASNFSSAVGSLKLAQARALPPTLPDLREGHVESNFRRSSETSPQPMVNARRTNSSLQASQPQTSSRSSRMADSERDVQDRRRSFGDQRSESGNGNGGGWLKTITSAWSAFKNSNTSNSPNEDEEEEREYYDRQAGGPSSSQPRRFSNNSSKGSPLKRPASTTGASLSAALASLTTRDPSHAVDGTTPTQSLVTRPSIQRGSVPAFATEIGHGEIPGDADHFSAGVGGEARSLASVSASGSGSGSGALESPILEAEDRKRWKAEERQRRKEERARAHRHQRSKDVSVLPPLLAPMGRTSSTSNVRPSHSHSHSRSSNRARAGTANSNGSGSTGNGSFGTGANSAGAGLSRPTTPGLTYTPSSPGASSRVAVLRSPSIQTSHEMSFSPSRTSSVYSNVGSAGTSPRRGGLGWGAMTSINSPAPHEKTYSSSLTSVNAARSNYASAYGGHGSQIPHLPAGGAGAARPSHQHLYQHHHASHGHHGHHHPHGNTLALGHIVSTFLCWLR